MDTCSSLTGIELSTLFTGLNIVPVITPHRTAHGHLVIASLFAGWIPPCTPFTGQEVHGKPRRNQAVIPCFLLKPVPVIRMRDLNEGGRPLIAVEAAKVNDPVFSAHILGELGGYVNRTPCREKRDDA